MKRGCRLGSVLLVLFIFQMLLSSCSEEPPEILSSDHRIRLVYQPVSGLVQVFLALHLELKGEAAAEAVEQWNVTTDNGNLQWLLGADDLSVMVIDDRTWVGTNTLAMPSKFPLPSGTYRVEIADRRGGADAIEISVPRPDLYSSLLSNPSGRFPSITRDAGNRLVLRSGGLGKVMVRGFDQEGRSLGGFVPETAVLAQNSADWQTIGSYSRTELFVIDPLTGVELVTVIDRLPPERMPE